MNKTPIVTAQIREVNGSFVLAMRDDNRIITIPKGDFKIPPQVGQFISRSRYAAGWCLLQKPN